MSLRNLKRELQKTANLQKAKILQRFFKTGKGEYGEGDVFLGVQVPQSRKIAKKYLSLNFNDLQRLLYSKIHEERLTALIILVSKYNKAKKEDGLQERIFDFYLKHRKMVNNWDLVDLSAEHIIGDHLLHKDKTLLFKLAASKNLWERRIAVLSTFGFIRNGHYSTTLKLAEKLLDDEEDLIHKAVGWMLREVGKRDIASEEKFLVRNHKKMPRTMLRYAIEKFDMKKRKFYLSR